MFQSRKRIETVMVSRIVLAGILMVSIPTLLVMKAAPRPGAVLHANSKVPPTLSSSTWLTLDSIKPQGSWYEAKVPDTLDLEERAKLAINALIGNLEPNNHYAVYQAFMFNADPPYADTKSETWNISPKNARTLPMLRAMSGSEFGLETEYGLMRALMSQIRDDGNMYYPFDGSGPPKGTSYPQVNAITIFAMLNWQARDKNPGWSDWIDLLAGGLKRDAIRVENRAYYPMQSGIDPEGNWHFMLHEGTLPIAYKPPDEPLSDQQGLEGAAKSDQNRPLSALIHDYELTGNKDSLATAQALEHFILKPGMWQDTTAEGYPGNEHGIWSGHGHNNPQALMALLDLATAENNGWLKQFVREGYDHAVRNGVVRIGFFPAWVEPEKFNRPAWLHGITETCGVADVMVLATKLSDAGLGDYWDDVDSIVRNQLAAQQISDLDLMRRATGGGAAHDALLQRFMGGFGNASPNGVPHHLCDLAGCCTANGSEALYYAWYGITRYDRRVATVNLFLNRASPWMDVDSYLPYEGKVVLHNKEAQKAMVRIPGWLDVSQVKTSVDGNLVHPPLAGRYLVIDNLKPKDEIRLEFPVTEEKDKYTIDGKAYEVTFRGSSLVDISPRDTDPKDYPLYQCDTLQGNKAPMRNVKRFVATNLIPPGTY
jgi:hypothetical protein